MMKLLSSVVCFAELCRKFILSCWDGAFILGPLFVVALLVVCLILLNPASDGNDDIEVVVAVCGVYLAMIAAMLALRIYKPNCGKLKIEPTEYPDVYSATLEIVAGGIEVPLQFISVKSCAVSFGVENFSKFLVFRHTYVYAKSRCFSGLIVRFFIKVPKGKKIKHLECKAYCNVFAQPRCHGVMPDQISREEKQAVSEIC